MADVIPILSVPVAPCVKEPAPVNDVAQETVPLFVMLPETFILFKVAVPSIVLDVPEKV